MRNITIIYCNLLTHPVYSPYPVATLGNISDPRIPMPWFNLFNGGLQGNNEHHIESISFSVPSAATLADAVMEASKIYQTFPQSLTKLMTPPKAPNNGKIGGYSPQCETMNEVLEAIKLTLIDLELADKVNLSINMNSGVYSSQIETDEGDEEIGKNGRWGAVASEAAALRRGQFFGAQNHDMSF